MSDKRLIERLSFSGSDLFLDREKVFTVPFGRSESPINVASVTEELGADRMVWQGKVYIGSGACCYGPLTIFSVGNEPKSNHATFKIPPFNIYDVLPVKGEFPKNIEGFANSNGVLVTGYGCAGAGVELVDENYPISRTIVGRDEFRKLMNRDLPSSTTPSLVASDGKVKLLIHDRALVDLTERLTALGLDLERTLEFNRSYGRINR